MTGDEEDNKIIAAVVRDAPTPLLIKELERRGFTVTDGQLPFVWDEDEEDGACREALSA